MNLKSVAVVYVVFACLVSGCQSSDVNAAKKSRYAWQNIYAGNPDLAGIEVWQYPREGNVYESKARYTKRHPAEIDYLFWDGRAYMTTYFPNGDVWDKGWVTYKIKPGDREWGYVDFSYGSDPNFERHADPRKKK